jgi:uncharacterized protein GlcG (DUF336 family)
MPLHRVQRREAADAVEAFEADGEQVVAVVTEGDHYVIFTRKSDGAVFIPVASRKASG